MIKIKTNDETLTIRVEGHAGYAEKGKDIVCSAVSILLYTYASELLRLGILSQIRDEENSYDIRPEADLETAKPAFETILSGLRLLSEVYKKNVRLEEMKRE